MADVVTLVETVGSTVAATAAIFGAAWRPVIKRHDQRAADDAFLHGRKALPGVPALSPAGDRLGKLEEAVGRIEASVDVVKAEVTRNGGTSLKDIVLNHVEIDERRFATIEAFMGQQVAEQKRVADQLRNREKGET